MRDPQLAIFLCCLLEGEGGPLEKSLLTKDLIPGEARASYLHLSTEGHERRKTVHSEHSIQEKVAF